MFDNTLLIYSDHCNFCSKFIELLLKHPDIPFTSLNIDIDPHTKQRPKLFFDIQRQLQHTITEVPTIITKHGEYVLSGEEAFKWLDFEIQSNNKNSIEGFNSNEMTSFSDTYAPLSGDSTAKDQSFKFLNKPDITISTPPEEQNNNNNNNNNNHLHQTRSQYNPSNIDFTNPNLFKPQVPNNSSNKQIEIDKRLSQLKLEREQFNPPPPQHNVNFSTGQIH
jgi:hypothetical protein